MAGPQIVRSRAAVFAITLLLVVAAVTAAPLFRQTATDRMDHAEYDVAQLVPEAPAATGQAAVPPTDRTGVVAIDLSHGNRVSPEAIQPLTSAITAAGYDVEFVREEAAFARALSRADSLVVIDPSQRFTDRQIGQVATFVNRGGRLVLIGEPTRAELAFSLFGQVLVPLPNRLGPLASRFGIEFSDGYLFNMDSNDGNYRHIFARGASGPRLAEGVDRAALYTAARVTARDGRPVLFASDGTRFSRTDATGRYPVAVVKGGVLAIGDKTFIERGNYQVLDNELFLANVVRFLVSGVRTRSVTDYPANLGPSPTIRYTTPGLLGAAQTLGENLRAGGASPRLELRRGQIQENGTDVLVTTYEYLEDHQLSTGIVVDRGRVKVGPYESGQEGIVVVRAPPQSGIDLVIVADTPRRAAQGADLVVERSLGQYLISDTTAVFRTGAAEPERAELGGEQNATLEE